MSNLENLLIDYVYTARYTRDVGSKLEQIINLFLQEKENCLVFRTYLNSDDLKKIQQELLRIDYLRSADIVIKDNYSRSVDIIVREDEEYVIAIQHKLYNTELSNTNIILTLTKIHKNNISIYYDNSIPVSYFSLPRTKFDGNMTFEKLFEEYVDTALYTREVGSRFEHLIKLFEEKEINRFRHSKTLQYNDFEQLYPNFDCNNDYYYEFCKEGHEAFQIDDDSIIPIFIDFKIDVIFGDKEVIEVCREFCFDYWNNGNPVVSVSLAFTKLHKDEAVVLEFEETYRSYEENVKDSNGKRKVKYQRVIKRYSRTSQTYTNLKRHAEYDILLQDENLRNNHIKYLGLTQSKLTDDELIRYKDKIQMQLLTLNLENSILGLSILESNNVDLKKLTSNNTQNNIMMQIFNQFQTQLFNKMESLSQEVNVVGTSVNNNSKNIISEVKTNNNKLNEVSDNLQNFDSKVTENLIKPNEFEKITFSDFLINHYDPNFLIKHQNGEKRLKKIYSTILTRANQYFGDKYLHEITVKALDEWIIHLQEKARKKIEPATIKEYLSKLSPVFSLAVTFKFLKTNVVIEYGYKAKSERKSRVLSEQEMAYIFEDALKVSRSKLFYLFLNVALNTGLRHVELTELRKSDIVKYKTHTEIKVRAENSKSNKERAIPLNNTVFDMLMEHVKSLKNDDDKIFKSKFRTAMPECAKRVNEKHNIPHFTIHDLRHTFATNLIHRGALVIQISKLLGHSDIKTTELYLHYSQDKLIDVVKLLDEKPTKPKNKKNSKNTKS